MPDHPDWGVVQPDYHVVTTDNTNVPTGPMGATGPSGSVGATGPAGHSPNDIDHAHRLGWEQGLRACRDVVLSLRRRVADELGELLELGEEASAIDLYETKRQLEELDMLNEHIGGLRYVPIPTVNPSQGAGALWSDSSAHVAKPMTMADLQDAMRRIKEDSGRSAPVYVVPPGYPVEP